MPKEKRSKTTGRKGEKKYLCDCCGTMFNQWSNLSIHLRTKHPTDDDESAGDEQQKQLFECDICSKVFMSRYTLKYHTMQLHADENEKAFECNVCGRRMAKKFMLDQHMVVHSTDKIPCPHCNRPFARKYDMEVHIKTVHMKIKPFACQYCTESFTSQRYLESHEATHVEEETFEEEQFEDCQQSQSSENCGQSYVQQISLENHCTSLVQLNSGNERLIPINGGANLYFPGTVAPAVIVYQDCTSVGQQENVSFVG